jgi:hypothetical protein
MSERWIRFAGVTTAVQFGVRQSVVRKEDDPPRRGQGPYIADSALRGTLCAVVLRSTHAHARCRIDARLCRARDWSSLASRQLTSDPCHAPLTLGPLHDADVKGGVDSRALRSVDRITMLLETCVAVLV